MTRLHVPIGVRWSDLDAYGHVNNVSMMRLFEEARIQAFWNDEHGGDAIGRSSAVLDARPGSETLSIIARQEVEYLVSIPYLRQPLDIELWIGKLGGASLEVCYEVHSPEGFVPRVLYTRAATSIVLVDATTARPRRINDRERNAWAPFLEEPVSFAKRRT